MTKTMKKGLLVVLFVVMAVAIGFASYAAFGMAKADVDQDSVDSFINYMKVFDTLDDISEATLFEKTENGSYKYDLWTAYTNAKNLYSNFSSEDKAVLGDAGVTFNRVDAIMGPYYTIVAQINSTLYRVDRSNTYADNDKVEAVRKAYDALLLDETYGEAKQAYVSNKTTGLSNLIAAEARMSQLKANIDAIADAINSIKYYDGSDMTSDPMYTGEGDGMNIVLASEASIQAVEAAITAVSGSVTHGDKLGDVPTSVYVDSDYVENWDAYEAAQKALAAQKAKAQAVIDMIVAAHKHASKGKLYYTIQDEIYAADEAYKALDSSEHNNIKSLVGDSNEETLDKMLSELDEIGYEIKDVEGVIAELLEQTAKYTEDYLEYIVAAEEALEDLDADILAYDRARYLAGGEDLEAGEDDAYGTGFPEYNVSYIVDGYDDLMAARAQYDAWEAEVDELVQKVKDMIHADEVDHENITNRYNEINSKYSNPNALTPEQLEAFKETVVDFQEGTATCEEVMAYYAAFVYRMSALTSELDNDIQGLYNATVGMSKCVYPYRDDVKELRNAYNALIGETPEAEPYVTRYNDLVAMEEEIAAEDALIEAWIGTVNAIKLPVTVGNMHLVDAAEEAFKLIVHGNGDALQALIAEGSMGNTVANEMDIDKAYEDYTTALAARKTLMDTINAAVKAMEDIDLKDAGNLALTEVPAWVEIVNKATEAYNAIADDETAENVSFEGAQQYLQGEYSDLYNDYLTALSYMKAYAVEAAIDVLSKDPETGLTEAKDVKDIVLGDADNIAKARDLYDAYMKDETVTTRKDIRNYDILVAAEKAFDKLVADLNGWMMRVYKLYASESDLAELDGLTGATLTKALEEALGKLGNYAYPLNIWEVGSEKLAEGEDSVHTLDAEYKKLADPDEQKYVEAGKVALDKLLANWEAAKEALQERIDAINEKVKKGEDLNSKDLDEVQSIIYEYDQYHESQKAEIKNYDDFQEAVDDRIAMDAFRDMYTQLYEQVVTNGNITSLTLYYIAVVRNVYNSFTPNVKAQFKDYSEKMAAIQEAYDKAVKEETVVALEDVKEALDQLREEYEATKKDLEATKKALEDAKADLEKKLSDLEKQLREEMADLEKQLGELDDKFTKDLADAIKAAKSELIEAISAAKKELQDQIDAINDEIGEINDAIEGLNGNVADLEAADKKLQENIDDANAAIDKAVKDAADALASVKGDLEAADKTLQAAIEKAVEDANAALKALEDKLQGNIDKAVSDASAALASAKADLEAADKKLQDNIDAANAAIEAAKKASDDAIKALEDTMNEALKDLEDKMNKADDDLMAEIVKLNKNLTIASVVLAVVLACACVCIVILFLKRK